MRMKWPIARWEQEVEWDEHHFQQWLQIHCFWPNVNCLIELLAILHATVNHRLPACNACSSGAGITSLLDTTNDLRQETVFIICKEFLAIDRCSYKPRHVCHSQRATSRVDIEGKVKLGFLLRCVVAMGECITCPHIHTWQSCWSMHQDHPVRSKEKWLGWSHFVRSRITLWLSPSYRWGSKDIQGFLVAHLVVFGD